MHCVFTRCLLLCCTQFYCQEVTESGAAQLPNLTNQQAKHVEVIPAITSWFSGRQLAHALLVHGEGPAENGLVLHLTPTGWRHTHGIGLGTGLHIKYQTVTINEADLTHNHKFVTVDSFSNRNHLNVKKGAIFLAVCAVWHQRCKSWGHLNVKLLSASPKIRFQPFWTTALLRITMDTGAPV